jgi:hypothetical protein
MMTLNGHVENGKIVLDQSVPLVDGTKVRVELALPQEPDRQDEAERSARTLYERWKPLFGMLKDGPTDFARNHNHYIHGTPKE